MGVGSVGQGAVHFPGFSYTALIK